MPDTDLERDLTRARAALLDAIQQPPLDQISGRATTLRRRRRAVRGGTALVAVMAVGVALLRPWAGSPDATPPPADTPPSGPVYADAGITINGLTQAVSALPDLPGGITDVEFADADHGYLLTTQRVFASTNDGGFTWQRQTVPAEAGDDLILFPNGQLALSNGVVSADRGRSWSLPPRHDAAAAGKDDLLHLGPQHTVQIWSPEHGYRGDVHPPLTVSWVAARPTADGIWWVGGTTSDGTDKPVLASSRDGGRTWQTVPLEAPSGQPQLSVLGRDAYAIVLGADRTIEAILYSADAGKTFTPTRTGGGGEPSTLAGDAVPLLDGRLLVTTTSHGWYVSDDHGATFQQASGTLPVVGALRRTWAGYVAYDLFGGEPAGWAAFSSDGSTWRKLHIR
jgi:Photosynthesis system II assembly factor YCF48